MFRLFPRTGIPPHELAGAIIRDEDIIDVVRRDDVSVIRTSAKTYESLLSMNDIMSVLSDGDDVIPVAEEEHGNRDDANDCAIPFSELPVGTKFRFCEGWWSQFDYTKTAEIAARRDGEHSPERLSEAQQKWLVTPIE